jgi:hypothetical protein
VGTRFCIGCGLSYNSVGLYSVAQSCLLVLSFLKAKRSLYYGMFDVNSSVYIGQLSFHIRRINFICFYIRLYIILLLWTFSKLFARFSFLFLKFISVINSSAFVSEDLNFKSLRFSWNFKLFLVAFSISLPILTRVCPFLSTISIKIIDFM